MSSPTFQSWFTVTNLHVWMLTTRLRALPALYAQAHVQGPINHFFFGVEDRIRQVLQPQSRSRSQPQAHLATTVAPTSSSSSSTVPSPEKNTSSNVQAGESPKKRGAAPESLVKKQMKIFREHWAGLGLALDIALAHDSDAMLAAAMWRNLLGARVLRRYWRRLRRCPSSVAR
jgi:cytochrome b pre-mRNA-processing protein 3